ncbi:Integrase H2C2 domain-containing protein [Abeliophyllum distichum]|uniref:Integrase H2C2 domain-containing protein n=1 Tax=Abeliophyllum distichum TaxID=126358 RepID=A0ABD1RD46_9LAMI
MENGYVDALSKLTSSRDFDLMKAIPVEKLNRSSVPRTYCHDNIRIPEVDEGDHRILDQPSTTERQTRSAKALQKGREEDAVYVMKKIHEGICDNHSEGMTLAQKALKQGYYWPTMKKDSHNYAKKCDRCQKFTTIPKLSAQNLTPVTIP